MDTSEVKINQVPHILPHQPDRENSVVGGPGERKYTSTVPQNSGINVDVPKNHVAYGTIQIAQNQLNDLSKSIRIADQTMGQIDDFIEKMKQNLVTHLKNFPPFLQGSEERIELLKLYNSFRKQIDRLTFPAEDQLAGEIMGKDTDASNHAPLVINADIEIQRQPVHAGNEGLNIPPLPKEATDEMIQQGIDRLEDAQTTLKQRRIGLAQDLQWILDRKTVT